MEAIGVNGELDLSNVRQISEVESGYSYFANGDIVVAKITPCFENGKGAVIRNLVGGVGFGTTELIVMRPSEQINAAYAGWLFLLLHSAATPKVTCKVLPAKSAFKTNF